MPVHVSFTLHRPNIVLQDGSAASQSSRSIEFIRSVTCLSGCFPALSWERVWGSVCGWHVPVTGSEASVWQDSGCAAQRGERAAHVEDGQTVPALAAGGPVHWIHGQDHRAGVCSFTNLLLMIKLHLIYTHPIIFRLSWILIIQNKLFHIYKY